MQLNFCGPLNANEDFTIQVCIVTNVMAEIHCERDWIQNHHGNGAGCMCVHIFKMVYLERDTQLRCPEPGLGTEEKVNWSPVFLSFGFLTAEAMRPAPSCSCLQVFPAMMAWALRWWSKWNSSLDYFSGITSPQWEKWLTLGNHPSSNSAH